MKKSKNIKKLIIAASALVIAVAVSTGATFAWFTTNSTAKVSGIEATVKADGDTDIMVAVGHDASTVTYKTSLTSSDLSSYVSSVSFEAVTNNAATGSAPTFHTASVENSVYTVATDDAETTSYVKIPITIRTSEAANVYLSDDSAVGAGTTGTTSTTVQEWRSSDITAYNATGTYTSGSYYTAYAYNAARVGFTTASGTVSGTGSTSTKPSESTFKVWSPNEAMYSGGEVTANTPADATVDRGTTIKTSDSNNYWANNLARDYLDYVYNISSGYSQAGYSTNYIAPEVSTNKTIATTVVDGTVGNSSYAYAYIYVYVWIEGTDGDCFNNILGQSISVSMNLTAEKVSQ